MGVNLQCTEKGHKTCLRWEMKGGAEQLRLECSNVKELKKFKKNQ